MAGQSLLQLLYLAILSRLVSPEAFGLIALANVVIGLAEIFANVGIGPALIQHKALEQRHINSAFIASVLLGGAFSAGMYFLAPLAADFYNAPELTPVLRVIGISFVLSAFAVLPRSLVQRELQYRKLFFVNLSSIALGNLTVGLVLAFNNFEVWALVWALLGQNVVMLVGLWLAHPVKLQLKWSGSAFKEMMGFGSGQSLAQLLNYAGVQADKVVLGRAGTLAGVGVYERAGYIVNLPVTILGKLTDTVIFSGLSRLQDEPAKLARAFKTGVLLIALVTLPLVAFLVPLADEVIYVLLGPEWPEAIPVFRVLLLALLFRALVKIEEPVLRSTGRVFAISGVKALFLAAVIAGTVVGVRYGIIGVAIGYCAALLVQFVAMTVITLKTTQLGPGKYLALFKAPVLLALLCGALAWGADALLASAGLPASVRLIGAAVPAAGLAAIALLRVPAILGREGFALLAELINRLPLPDAIKVRFRTASDTSSNQPPQ